MNPRITMITLNPNDISCCIFNQTTITLTFHLTIVKTRIQKKLSKIHDQVRAGYPILSQEYGFQTIHYYCHRLCNFLVTAMALLYSQFSSVANLYNRIFHCKPALTCQNHHLFLGVHQKYKACFRFGSLLHLTG